MKLFRRYSLLLLLAMYAVPSLTWGQGYTISTYAGGGTDFTTSGVRATLAAVGPEGVAVDSASNVYVTQSFYSDHSFVSKVTPNGIITTIAGNPSLSDGFSGDGGPATSAQLSFSGIAPSGIAVDAQGNIYFSDDGNKRVRKIDSKGIITTVAGGGTPNITTYGDGGPATAAYLPGPTGVAVDSAGNLYIADWIALRVRKVTPSGTISTVAGCGLGICALNYFSNGSVGDGGPATSAYLQPYGIAVDGNGNLYIADLGTSRVRKVSANGTISTVAGSASGSYGGDGGPGTSAGLLHPSGVAADSAGNLYIADSGDYRIRMVTPGGTISTIAGNGAAGQPSVPAPSGVSATSIALGFTTGLALGPSGQIYIADYYFGIRVLTNGNTAPGGTSTPPTVTSSGIVSASAFGGSKSIAPGSWIEIYGSNLASNTRGWAGSDFNGNNAPTALDGVSVTIGGQSAFIAYISPGQVNAQVPSNVPAGSQALVLKTAAGASSSINVNVNNTQPGLLAPSSFNVNGTQYVAAFFADGSFDLPPGSLAGVSSRSAKSGDTITLYGVGFGATTPNFSAGQIVQQSNTLTQSFKVNFGNTPATVVYNGLAPGLVGVYQFNVVVPTIASSSSIPITFSLNSAPGTQTLYTAVQN